MKGAKSPNPEIPKSLLWRPGRPNARYPMPAACSSPACAAPACPSRWVNRRRADLR